MTSTRHSLDEWLKLIERQRVELLDGRLVDKSGEASRGLCLAALLGTLGPVFGKRSGGWWLLPGVDLQLGGDGFQFDLAGWRRDRPFDTHARPVTQAPDWTCEILTETSHSRDTLHRLRQCHAAQVRHCWILDPADGSLQVFTHEPRGYVCTLTASRAQLVRAEPFEAIEVKLATLFGDDEP